MLLHICDSSMQEKDEDLEFGSSLGYLKRTCLKKKKKKKTELLGQ